MNLATSNIFAALDSKKAKKKSSKEDKDKKKKKSSSKKAISTAELERALFSQPAIGVGNWADDDDDYDDGFHPVTAAHSAWTNSNQTATNGTAEADNEEDTDEEVEVDIEHELGVELGHDDEEDVDEEKDDESKRQSRQQSAVTVKAIIEPEKQLSKKELKKKGLEEMEQVFAELGIQAPTKEDVQQPVEKKKKKKDKVKDKKDDEDASPTRQEADVPANADVEQEDSAEAGESLDPAQVKAKLLAQKKKAQDVKKKAVSAAALNEAKARQAKLKALKDTKHYNQAPKHQ